MKRLLERSTGDLLVLLIAGTVCFSVLASGATVALVRILQPDTDVTGTTSVISDTINTLIGLLAGFLAGRTDANMQQGNRGTTRPRDE